jgi:hypothetical protein
LKLVRKGLNASATRWVEPFPDDYPKFRVEVRRSSRSESSKIMARFGLTPAKRVPRDFDTVIAMDREFFRAQFVSAEGEKEIFGEELTDDNREKAYIETQIYRPPLETEVGPACTNCGQQDHMPENGEVRESVWSFINRKSEDEEAIALKN